MSKPLKKLKHHVTGAIKRGEKKAIKAVIGITPNQLVAREVGHCVSYLIDNLCKLYWAENSARHAANPTAYPKLKAPDINFDEDDIQELFSDRNGEVFEHWIVSSWFGEKLKERGEVVVEICNLDIWCRTTSGQQISADRVIEEITKEVNNAKGEL